MMGPHSSQGTLRGMMGGRRGLGLYERPLISEMLSVQQQLGLSAQQVQQLQTLRTDFEKDAIKRDAEIRTAEIDLSQLLLATPPDMAKVEAQVKKIAALRGDLRLARIKTLEEGRAVLTQEQWQKFGSLAPQTGRMGSYRGPWDQGQPGPGPRRGYGMMGPGMMGMMGGYGHGGMMGGYGQQ